jgi:hypothetical protein
MNILCLSGRTEEPGVAQDFVGALAARFSQAERRLRRLSKVADETNIKRRRHARDLFGMPEGPRYLVFVSALQTGDAGYQSDADHVRIECAQFAVHQGLEVQ